MKIKEENKKQLILRAAENEFMMKGFDGAKTTSIAKAAGVTHAMLHYYFNKKENLFNEVFENKLALIFTSLTTSFNNPDLSFIDKIKLGMELHFDFLAANPTLPRFLINELIARPERLQIFENNLNGSAKIFIQYVQELIDNEVQKGEINEIEAIQLIINIGSLNVFVFTALPLIESFAFPPHMKVEFLEKRKQENIKLIMTRLKRK